MMNKTLFTAALACVMAFGGFALSAQTEEGESSSIVATMPRAKIDVNLKDNLITIANEKGTFGYKTENSFVSLNDFIETDDGKATVSLGSFNQDGIVQFGFNNTEDGFLPARFDKISVSGDPGYSYSYNPDGFYSLDFSKDPFNGDIEILVVGEPLPASTVTLLVALSTAAIALLLYNRRRQMLNAERA